MKLKVLLVLLEDPHIVMCSQVDFSSPAYAFTLRTITKETKIPNSYQSNYFGYNYFRSCHCLQATLLYGFHSLFTFSESIKYLALSSVVCKFVVCAFVHVVVFLIN